LSAAQDGSLIIGQGNPDLGVPEGALVWDGKMLRVLELGSRRFINAHVAGEAISLAITRPEGVVLIQTSEAALRALPPADRVAGPIVVNSNGKDTDHAGPDTHAASTGPDDHATDRPSAGAGPDRSTAGAETHAAGGRTDGGATVIAYATAVPGFKPGDLHDNGNGTVSVKKPNGKWLCVTPTGAIEERDTPGGAWESFVLAKNGASLIAWRDAGSGGNVPYVLPIAE